MDFDPGFAIEVDEGKLTFRYGADAFGPVTEHRRLNDIRPSLANPAATGPEVVYGIAMDTGARRDRDAMIARNLLFGVVAYAAGTLGREPVRSQGHVHARSASCGASTCEVYEVWQGHACIYMQEFDGDDAGRCRVVHAGPGDVVVVPPGWVHATVNADPSQTMVFGAWCVRDYGFDYRGVRAHGGIAFFPEMAAGELYWRSNGRYSTGLLREEDARPYSELGIEDGVPIYTQFARDPDRFLFVAQPHRANRVWREF